MDNAKVKHFSIVFDGEDAETFKPGELLSGKVLVEFSQPTKVKGLRIEIFGESVVGWNVSVENPNEKGKFHDVMLSSQEENLSAKFYALGSETARPVELPLAQLAYPFRFRLPIDLPSSLEHQYGHIRYYIKAVFERPWQFNYEIKTSFTIVSNYDLNEKPQAAFPIEEDIRKSFLSCCCLCVGNLNLTISMPSRGFAAGQVMPVTVHCENQSTVNVSKIKLYLKKKLKFYATRPTRDTKEEEVVVAKTKCERPYTASSDEDVTIQMKVPPLPSSGLEYCSIMDLEYTLTVVIAFSGIHLSVERTFPVLIGTVPLRIYNAFETDNANAVVAQQATAPLLEEPHLTTQVINDMKQPAMNPTYPGPWDSNTSPPPPYDASVGGAQNIGQNKDKSMYVHGAGTSGAVPPAYAGYNYAPVNMIS